MTEREAFEKEYKGKMVLAHAMPGNRSFHKDYAYSDAQTAWNAWKAACKWQRERDAEIASELFIAFGENGEACYDMTLSDAILNQREEE